MSSSHTFVGMLRGLWRVIGGIVFGIVFLLMALLTARTGDWLLSGLFFLLFLGTAYFVNARRKNLVVSSYEGELDR